MLSVPEDSDEAGAIDAGGADALFGGAAAFSQTSGGRLRLLEPDANAALQRGADSIQQTNPYQSRGRGLQCGRQPVGAVGISGTGAHQPGARGGGESDVAAGGRLHGPGRNPERA